MFEGLERKIVLFYFRSDCHEYLQSLIHGSLRWQVILSSGLMLKLTWVWIIVTARPQPVRPGGHGGLWAIITSWHLVLSHLLPHPHPPSHTQPHPPTATSSSRPGLKLMSQLLRKGKPLRSQQSILFAWHIKFLSMWWNDEPGDIHRHRRIKNVKCSGLFVNNFLI